MQENVKEMTPNSSNSDNMPFLPVYIQTISTCLAYSFSFLGIVWPPELVPVVINYTSIVPYPSCNIYSLHQKEIFIDIQHWICKFQVISHHLELYICSTSCSDRIGLHFKLVSNFCSYFKDPTSFLVKLIC